MNLPNDTGPLVYSLLVGAGFNKIQAQYITSQAAHETANFTSPVFKRNNNLFGMRQAIKRNTVGLGDFDADGYANYRDIAESVQDYRLWYISGGMFNQYLSIETFVYALKIRKYFEASIEEYVKGIRHFYTLYFGS